MVQDGIVCRSSSGGSPGAPSELTMRAWRRPMPSLWLMIAEWKAIAEATDKLDDNRIPIRLP